MRRFGKEISAYQLDQVDNEKNGSFKQKTQNTKQISLG